MNISEPCILPSGWTEHYDEVSGSPYYYNMQSGETQWEVPSHDAIHRPSTAPSHFFQPPGGFHPHVKYAAADVDMKESDDHTPATTTSSPLNDKPNVSAPKKLKLKALSLPSKVQSKKVVPTNDNGVDQTKSRDDDGPCSLPSHRESPQESTNEGKSLIGGKQQDYIGLSKIYQIQRPYSDPKSNVKCVLCHRHAPDDVLYPCQHRCVCRRCIISEVIVSLEDANKHPKGHVNCPLCGTVIKKIIPAEPGGTDEDTYW
eukprot:CAMPEP_0185034540 /NCGR_PEP_ID=MMETSP1103-20130426/24520_1 /TAXON_ID=36769 /ORGANISM="Paraphysomonas bandaiensis, Strain Caron Lab Isolate" /LENGTH=257 /DNA_ID=CAMNT_0027571239 /DNA_START=173 /DNA_END=943 /DNA_ORIENTATION=+